MRDEEISLNLKICIRKSTAFLLQTFAVRNRPINKDVDGETGRIQYNSWSWQHHR
jgi:hypothetical protein